MKPKPYVGITGFKTKTEIDEISRTWEEQGRDLGYKFMFGFICSAKRLKEKEKSGTESPSINDLPILTGITPRFGLPMIHYYTPNRERLSQELQEVFSTGKMYEQGFCRAVQLNMTWPDPDQIQEVKKEFPNLEIVLQLPKETLHEVERVKEY